MYEIPQQLEYKEKIVFGLTFKQLAYALSFFPIIFILLFKISAPLSVRIMLAIFPVSIATGFMFFDLSTLIINWYNWYKQRVLEEEQVNELWGVKEIKEQTIITKKKKLAVLKAESINFSIKSEDEQEVIILTFKKLLNSLDFPLQIVMNTEKLSLSEYIKSLDERSDKTNKGVLESYKRHLESLFSKKDALNRNFYLVIPETGDLDVQVRLCEERLSGLNIQTKRLNDNELKKLFEAFHPVTSITNKPDYLVIGKDTYSRVLYASGYPRSVEKGFLDRLVSFSGNFDLSIHINPEPLELTMVLLNRELIKQRADLYASKLKNQLNPSLEIKYEDTRRVLENLQRGTEKLFNVSMYINCKAESLEELDHLSRKVESELNSLLIIPRKPKFRMIQGLKSCTPLGEDFLNQRRNLTSHALSAFFPFTSSFFKFDETGVWMGVNQNGIPIIRDVFKLSNPNGVCLASSGAGKSYLTKLFVTRHLLNGTKVIVIDPQGEYTNLIEKFEGQRIDLSKNSDTIINPLDLMGHDFHQKRLSLMDLMNVMLGDLSEPQKAFIDQAITDCYEGRGITLADPESWDNEPPILGDLLASLLKIEKNVTIMEKSTLRSLVNRLKLYVDGVFSFLNRPTELDFNNRFVCFDIGNLPKQVKPVMMFLVLDYVYTKMKSDLTRKLLVVDEAWSLLSRSHDASYIFEIVKTCRKFNMGLYLINQEVEGMLNSEAGRSVLANSAYTILLKQKPAVIDSVKKVFNLSSNEKIALLTANIGEGLMIIEDEHTKVKIIASKEEHKQITTNADELLKENQKEEKNKSKNKKRVKISLDFSKRLFRISKLNQDEIRMLRIKKYQEGEYNSLVTSKKEKFFLKPRHNETLTHLFVTLDTAEYLENKGFEVQLYTTKKPDIVFMKGKKKYAVEVETGKVLEKARHQLKEKVKELNKEYDDWFFIVTNRNKVKAYSEYGQSLDLRYLKPRLNSFLRQIGNSHPI